MSITKTVVLPWFVCGLQVSAPASAQGVAPSFDLATCERVMAAFYDGRLPVQVDGLTVRRAVECRPGVTKPVLIHHEDQVQETVSPEELARMRPAVQRTGRDNPLVCQRCAQPAFRALLGMADVAFRLHAREDELGTVLISEDMCPTHPLPGSASGDQRPPGSSRRNG